MKKILQILLFWFLVIAFSLLPLSLTRFGVDLYMLPQIEIAIAFFLSIYTNILPLQLFLYGLLIDIAYGTQIGVSALILLLINRIIFSFKSNLSKLAMKSIIFYFAITFSIVMIFKYILFAFSNGTIYHHDLKLIIINLLINIGFYPILHFILMRNKVTTII